MNSGRSFMKVLVDEVPTPVTAAEPHSFRCSMSLGGDGRGNHGLADLGTGAADDQDRR